MIKINLAPLDRRHRRRFDFQFALPSFNLGVLFAAIYIGVVVLIGGYWGWRWRTEVRLAAAVENDKRELASLKATIGQGAKVKEQLADLQNRIKAIQELTKNQGRPIKLLDAFLDTVPPDLWITSLQESGSSLRVSGTAFSSTAVADFMANLRRSGKFKDVDIIVARQDLAKSPRPVTFEVTCRFEI
ncbi:MAG TPA: PilN domain-containing protein [Methylomirabilota bacterium]|jgi:Tfp pilus assembly protein PilN|nr:PilN domain-containing protein [Methylomirabilota bacterium]